MGRDGREVSINKMEKLGPGVEFYPVDPLSREMGERLRMLNMSLSDMVHLTSGNMEGSPSLTACTDIATPTHYQVGREHSATIKLQTLNTGESSCVSSYYYIKNKNL